MRVHTHKKNNPGQISHCLYSHIIEEIDDNGFQCCGNSLIVILIMPAQGLECPSGFCRGQWEGSHGRTLVFELGGGVPPQIVTPGLVVMLTLSRNLLETLECLT